MLSWLSNSSSWVWNVRQAGPSVQRPAHSLLPGCGFGGAPRPRAGFAEGGIDSKAFGRRALDSARVARRIGPQVRVVAVHWVGQLGPDRLRPDQSKREVADVLAATSSPAVFSMLTVDSGWTPERYERWLAGALPGLLLGTG
jgi:hypothetical protein